MSDEATELRAKVVELTNYINHKQFMDSDLLSPAQKKNGSKLGWISFINKKELATQALREKEAKNLKTEQ